MFRLLLLSFCVCIITNCTPIKNDAASVDVQDNAQQIGDIMASVDEAGKGSGTIASYKTEFNNSYARFVPTSKGSLLFNEFSPNAVAVSTTCSTAWSESCVGSSIIHNYNGCTIGSATVSGTATLTWAVANSGCSISGDGGTITRVPNISITGLRNATLSITKSATVGQVLTRVNSTSFNLTNDGIRRKFTLGSTTLLDKTTSTVTGSPITITGTSRTSRVMNGGYLRVFNNISNTYCDYTPESVTWSTTSCNCPVQGRWKGTCSDSKSVTLDITGCGTATYTEGNDTSSVNLDRCGT
jgi:hypothetical protein